MSIPTPKPEHNQDEEARLFYESLEKTGQLIDIGGHEDTSKLPARVTLSQIKADPAFKTFPLVRISRLSVMPVTDAEWARIERLAGQA